ncbi:hypothetical protein [Streptomyces sp. NPDC101150]|uniref:hypothetical protein n=1 Tax=Streptomyces sp. NPDC101150 TaxID=3366114 RepID=UPI0038255256
MPVRCSVGQFDFSRMAGQGCTVPVVLPPASFVSARRQRESTSSPACDRLLKNVLGGQAGHIHRMGVGHFVLHLGEHGATAGIRVTDDLGDAPAVGVIPAPLQDPGDRLL